MQSCELCQRLFLSGVQKQTGEDVQQCERKGSEHSGTRWGKLVFEIKQEDETCTVHERYGTNKYK